MKTEFKITKDKSKITLKVKGDLVAKSSEQFKEHLQQLLEKTAARELSLKEVSVMDVSALQLIKSFKAELAGDVSSMLILPPNSNDLIGLLDKTGLVGIIQSTK